MSLCRFSIFSQTVCKSDASGYNAFVTGTGTGDTKIRIDPIPKCRRKLKHYNTKTPCKCFKALQGVVYVHYRQMSAILQPDDRTSVGVYHSARSFYAELRAFAGNAYFIRSVKRAGDRDLVLAANGKVVYQLPGVIKQHDAQVPFCQLRGNGKYHRVISPVGAHNNADTGIRSFCKHFDL